MPRDALSATFADVAEGTLMRFEQSGYTSTATRDGNAQGWDEYFRKLAVGCRCTAVIELTPRHRIAIITPFVGRAFARLIVSSRELTPVRVRCRYGTQSRAFECSGCLAYVLDAHLVRGAVGAGRTAGGCRERLTGCFPPAAFPTSQQAPKKESTQKLAEPSSPHSNGIYRIRVVEKTRGTSENPNYARQLTKAEPP